MIEHTLFDTTTRLYACRIQGDINTEHYLPTYRFFNGDYREGYYLGEDLETLMEKTAVTYYIDKSTIIADGIDSCILSGLPEGTELSVLGQTETETDGVIGFQTDLAGTYQLTLSHPLHLNTLVEIVAV